MPKVKMVIIISTDSFTDLQNLSKLILGHVLQKRFPVFLHYYTVMLQARKPMILTTKKQIQKRGWNANMCKPIQRSMTQ